MATYEPEHPLHQAAAEGDVGRIRDLLASGISVNARTRFNETPLIVASRLGNLDALQALVQAGANVDAKTKSSSITEGRLSALHSAVGVGHHRAAKLLLEAGADVDSLSQSKRTPLVTACIAENADLIRLLLDHGANPNGLAPCYDTPLTAAAGRLTGSRAERESWTGAEEHAAQIVRELLLRGANPNLAGGGEYPLHRSRSVAVTRELIAAGADVNTRDLKGQTPLVLWALNGKFELLRCYVEAGADPNAVADDGTTALCRVIKREPPETQVIDLLLNAGADLNYVDRWGLSVLDRYERWLEGRKGDLANSDPRMLALSDRQFYVDEMTQCVEYISARGAKRCFDPNARRQRKKAIDKGNT
jgi:ankyrin repeat protein